MDRLKRFVSFLLLLAVPGLSFANDCQPTSNCIQPLSCNWSAASSWTGCGGTIPQPADTVTMGNGQSFDVRFDAQFATVVSVFVGTTNIFGCTGTASQRFLTLSKNDTTALKLWGVFRPCNGLNITFSAASGTPGFEWAAGHWDSDNVDLGSLKTVTAFASSPTSGACIVGDNWTVTTADDMTGLAAGDVVQFTSGAARGRMYEIKAVSPLTLCPSLPDGVSQGPRLTPHATRNAIDQPGNVPVQIPAVGDTFLAWKPWKVDSTTVPWTGSGGVTTERSEWIGGEFDNMGPDFQAFRAAGAPPFIFAHMNVHDGTGGVAALWDGGTATDGPSKILEAWNVIHDNAVADAHYQLGVERGGAGSPSVGGLVAFNTFYRTAHNNINLNNAGTAQNIVGTEVSYNIGFELDTSNSGEAEFIELDNADHLVVQSNAAWHPSQRMNGIITKPATAANWQNNLVRWNYLQGFNLAITMQAGGNLFGADNYAIGNFTDSSFRRGIQAWGAHYNLVRRWSEGNFADGNFSDMHGIAAHKADGNILDGGGSARAVEGIGVFADATDTTTKRVYRNNLFRNMAYVSGGLFKVGVALHDANVANVDVLHNIMDCGSEANCQGILNTPDAWAPGSPVTLNLKDNIVLGSDAGAVDARTTCGVNVTDNLVNLTRFGGIGAAFGTWSVQTGENERNPLFVDSPNLDFNLLTASKELGAGAVPSGSSIGLRYLSFPKAMFPVFIQSIMPGYLTVATEPIQDIDLDGFVAFNANDADSPDKCPFIPDFLNATDNGGTTCKNLAAGAGKALNKGAN